MLVVDRWTEPGREWFPIFGRFVNCMKNPGATLDRAGRNGVHFTQLNHSLKCDEGIMRPVRASRESAVGGSRWANGEAVSCLSRSPEQWGSRPKVGSTRGPRYHGWALDGALREAARAATRVVPRLDLYLIVPKHEETCFGFLLHRNPSE